LEACRVHKGLVKNIVVASSDKAYGQSEILPYTEETSLVGRFPYDVSKSCTDLIAQSYWHSFALPVVIARCGNIYGGGDLNWSRIVPGTIRSFLMQESPIIRSDGKFVRDYVYVKDVSRFYLQVAEHLESRKLAGQAFNYSLQEPVSVLEIVKKIATLMECQHLKPKIMNTARGEIHSQWLSSKKLRKAIPLSKEYSLDDGLAETIDWYKEFLGR
jgi:CDP-glucose 4,6-dehydratase